MTAEQKLVGRHKRLAFLKVGTGEESTYDRLTGFTTMSEAKEAKEYSRQYVDEAAERTDVVGYATGIEYSFDRYENNPVHEKIARISDDEIVGTDAQAEVVTVDIFDQDAQGNCPARKRIYSIVPETTGDGTDALIYSGTFKAASEIVKGYCNTTDNWQTCTFTEGDRPSVQ